MRRSITYWGAKKRLNLLTTFREDVIGYFETAHWDMYSDQWEGNEGAPELRQQINEHMRAVDAALHFVGISTEVDYAPPAATGGLAGRIALLDHLFDLPKLGVPLDNLVDSLDRAIGIYRSWLPGLRWRVFNPFYWMGWGLTFGVLEKLDLLDPVVSAVHKLLRI